MPRLARAVAVDCAHHIVQRGNNRQDVFFVDGDKRVYLDILGDECDKYALEVAGYCLMTNHVHLVATPQKEDSLAKAVGRAHFRYTQYINRFHKRSGHLWQGRFYSCALDERHFWEAMRYVELNPVRAKMCRKAWRYEWSSAAAHVDAGNGDGRELLNLAKWYDEMGGDKWRGLLEEGVDEEGLARLRLNTRTGRPLGSDGFLSKIESVIGRRVRALPHGRPRKKEEE